MTTRFASGPFGGEGGSYSRDISIAVVVQATEFQDGQWRAAHGIALRWAELESSGRITRRNEEQLKGEFIHEFFGEILGYTFYSDNAPQWTLDREYRVNGGFADAAIGQFTQDQPPLVRALVEVKGPSVSLDRDHFNEFYCLFERGGLLP